MEDSLRDTPPGPQKESRDPAASTAPGDIDTFMAEAGAKIEKWEKFVEEQQQKRAEAAAQLQDIMDADRKSVV